MVSTIFDYLLNHYSGWWTAIIALAIVIGWRMKTRRVPRYLMTGIPATGFLLSLWQNWAWGSDPAKWKKCFLAAAIFVAAGCIFRYVWQWLRIKKAAALCQDELLEKVRQIDHINGKSLTPAQFRRYRGIRICAALALGDLQGAEDLIGQIDEKDDSAGKHYWTNLLYVKQGKLKEAQIEGKKALDRGNAREDPALVCAVLNNQAGALIHQGHFEEADNLLTNAIGLARKRRIRDRDVICPVYFTYAMNRMRLGDDRNTCLLLADELQQIRPHDIRLSVAAMNLRLTILRQTHAEPAIINAQINQNLQSVIDSRHFGDSEKFSFVVSTAGVYDSPDLDPTPCVHACLQYRGRFETCTAMERFEGMHSISKLLRQFPVTAETKEGAELAAMVQDYEKFRAGEDCRYLLHTTDRNAVLYRVHLLEQRTHYPVPGLSPDDVKAEKLRYFQQAEELCERHGLLRRAIEVHLNCADEFISPDDRCQGGLYVRDPDLVRNEVLWVENHLAALVEAPDMTSVLIRLSYYCFLTADYEKAYQYWCQLKGAHGMVSLLQSAYWIQQYYAILTVFARCWCFFRQARAVFKDRGMDLEGDGGLLFSCLLCLYMGYQSPRVRQTEDGHTWAYLPGPDMEIDFTGRKVGQPCFFLLNHHTLEKQSELREVSCNEEFAWFYPRIFPNGRLSGIYPLYQSCACGSDNDGAPALKDVAEYVNTYYPRVTAGSKKREEKAG